MKMGFRIVSYSKSREIKNVKIGVNHTFQFLMKLGQKVNKVNEIWIRLKFVAGSGIESATLQYKFM